MEFGPPSLQLAYDMLYTNRNTLDFLRGFGQYLAILQFSKNKVFLLPKIRKINNVSHDSHTY